MFQAQGLIYWTYTGATFKSASPNTTATSKTGQTTANFQSIFTKVIIQSMILMYISKLQPHEGIMRINGFVN